VTGRGGVALLLAALVVAAAGTALHFASATHTARAGSSPASARRAASRVSLPLFFEPNQGQTDPQVRFLARGVGYSLFLTANEAVLELQPSAVSHQPSAVSSQPAADNVIRMRLDGANSSARVSGAEPLPGKSNYFIGNDPAKWHRDIPHFARVNYAAVYPGVDLVYYGNQGQLEYDFRVAPGADPGQIVLNFDGASARLDSGELVLSTGQGDVYFHAPQIYQQEGNTRKTIAGSFRQLADNKIGFSLGAYDRSRELVIDPTLSYSTYLGGGSGAVGESLVKVAVDSGLNIYVAGSTTSADFPLPTNPNAPPPIQSHLGGPNAQNIFIAKLNPSADTQADQLEFSTYLGGSGIDQAAGVAVDSSGNIYVAGTTSSADFPITPNNAFQTSATFAGTQTHGFLSKVNLAGSVSALSYSTFLAGNGTDAVTGLAIDSKQDAFVTGTTTSTDVPSTSVGFPANLNGFQQMSNAANQSFASEINTAGSGFTSMLYSTYFGGGNPVDGQTVGGGIAVDSSGNLYITGATNFVDFPVLNALQTCLNEPSQTANCTNPAPSNVDAFVAKINPNVVGAASLLYSTYLGGSGNDTGTAIAADGSANAYVTGSTDSTDFPVTTTAFQLCLNNTSGSPCPASSASDAFIGKIGNPVSGSSVFPLNYATYLGGSGTDVGQAIAVDAVQAAHVTGSTDSPDLKTLNPIDNQTGSGIATDAFVALILTTVSGRPTTGDYLSYLGGGDFDQGTGIALDLNNATYVAGETKSGDFPNVNPSQGLAGTQQNAFVSRIVGTSGFAYTSAPTVSPNPGTVGNQVTFTFTFTNNGPDAANNVIFGGSLSGTGLGTGLTFTSANSSPGGTCPSPVSGNLICNIGSVAANGQVTVTVILVPTSGTTTLTVVPTLSANGSGFGGFSNPSSLSVPVVDFSIATSQTSQTVVAGNSTSYTVTLAPVPAGSKYTGSISMSFSALPSGATGTWTTNPVTISGNTSTTLNIATTARPVQNGGLQHRGPLYATWLPVAGLSLLGLGFGAGWKRRRWVAGAVVGLIAGIILLQPACGSSRSTPPAGGGTPAGTYPLTLTATSGSQPHNVLVTLIVQ
jgi:uncharacterized repeat protein (TIGR01451 family)